jgi:ubiquitin-conjugating enzyme E2 W
LSLRSLSTISNTTPPQHQQKNQQARRLVNQHRDLNPSTHTTHRKHGSNEQQAPPKGTCQGTYIHTPHQLKHNLTPTHLPQIQGLLPPGIALVSAPDLKEWQMDISILDNPLYSPTDKYRLKFTFSTSYPIEAPEVVFLSTPDRTIPMHPHVYSNGIICLDLLDSQGWSPVHNVESVCISIQSMLASNTKAESKFSATDREGVFAGRTREADDILLQDRRATRSLFARTSRDRGISTSSTMIRRCRRGISSDIGQERQGMFLLVKARSRPQEIRRRHESCESTATATLVGRYCFFGKRRRLGWDYSCFSTGTLCLGRLVSSCEDV